MEQGRNWLWAVETDHSGPLLHKKYPILVIRGQNGVKLAKIGIFGALMHHGVNKLEEDGCNVMWLGLMK